MSGEVLSGEGEVICQVKYYPVNATSLPKEQTA